MATTTAPSPQRVQQGPGVFVRVLLPAFLLLTLLAGVAAAVVYAVFWYLPRVADGRDLVLRRFEEPISFGGKEYNPYLWFGLLIPVLMIGLVYVIWMYVRDGVTIGWAWASFLGALRCTVYALLAIVFLLPALQAWETATTESKVVVVFDVSGSHLFVRDEVPGPDTPLEKLLTRQDKVLNFLGSERVNFFKRLHDKNPVTAYRFGRHLDESYLVLDKSGLLWTQDVWEKRQQNGEANLEGGPVKGAPLDYLRGWLKPELSPDVPESLNEKQREEFFKRLENLRRLTGATNLGTPLRKVYDREKNNLLQGIVVFTDGRNTEGSTDSLKALIEDARKADPQVPIFVVAVGEERERVRIEITDLRVPEQIRPEDRFRATVDLAGEGLVDREVEVALDIFRVGRKSDKPEGEIVLVETKNGEPTGAEIALGERVTLKAPAKFLPGNPPHAQVEFPLDAAALAKAVGKEAPDGIKLEFKDDAEGQLRFQARVARDAREDFADKEHKSDPADVQVVKRPLRVLLMASGPMRDYQFVRTLLVRETDKNRAELSIYLQPVPGQEEPRKGRVQDVPPDRLLGFFPPELRDEKLDKGEEKYKNLASYDVIVAYDPDWERLDPQHIRNIEQWVDKHGGGLIVIGGPVNTIQLARPAVTRDRNHKLRPMHDLYPVILADSRVQEVTRETDKPWRLSFPGATDDMEFLKIDEEAPKDKPLWGWELFFTAQGGPGVKPEPAPNKQAVRRGFYNFYPVKGKKEGAVVVATFTDDRARLEDGSEQPYIVTMPYGSGRTVWLGSAESWRLRQFKEAYHERFWTKLARYAGAGNTSRLNRRLILNMGRTFTANNFINVEAQVFGTDMKPLPQKSKIRVTVQPPASAKEIEKEQAFDLEPKPVGGGEWNGWFSGRFLVKTPGQYNLELEVPETKDRATGKFSVKESNPELDNTRPDFTALHELASDARRVLERVPEDVRRELQERLRRRKVAEADLKIAKPETEAKKEPAAAEERLKLYFDLSTADVIPSCMTVETKTQRNRGATNDLWDGGFTIWEREPPEEPIRMSYVLAVVAGLLSVEWLTRKLLRLA